MNVIKQLILKLNQNILLLILINTKKYGTVVKEHEFNKPDTDSVNYILNDTIKDCRNKFFQSFEYRCVYDNKFIYIRNNEEVILSIKLEHMNIKSQFYGLDIKLKMQETMVSFLLK